MELGFEGVEGGRRNGPSSGAGRLGAGAFNASFDAGDGAPTAEMAKFGVPHPPQPRQTAPPLGFEGYDPNAVPASNGGLYPAASGGNYPSSGNHYPSTGGEPYPASRVHRRPSLDLLSKLKGDSIFR